MKGDFIKLMSDKKIENMKREGATETALAKAKKQMDDFAVMYKNPAFRAAITLMEIAPVGILISLLSVTLLRRKEFLPPPGKI
ncbi:MAG: hypothetical protein ABUT20_65240 [Bacteroidota bacterium]